MADIQCRSSNILLMTAEFQAIIADMVTNEQRAKFYLEKTGGGLSDNLNNLCENHLNLLSENSCRRVMILASLLSKRRFTRALNLLPASRQILGNEFESQWNVYLNTVPAGMPSATQEAVNYANFLKRIVQASLFKNEVLHYESCLNEVSRRLYLCDERLDVKNLPEQLRIHHHVQLSPYVLIASFSYDMVKAVKQLRAGNYIEEVGENIVQSVIFRPKHSSGIAVDVSIIPEALKSLLLRVDRPISISELLSTEPLEMHQSTFSKLEYLLSVGVLTIFLSNDL